MIGSHGFAARGALPVQTRRHDERFDRIRSIERGAAPDLAAIDDYDEAAGAAVGALGIVWEVGLVGVTVVPFNPDPRVVVFFDMLALPALGLTVGFALQRLVRRWIPKGDPRRPLIAQALLYAGTFVAMRRKRSTKRREQAPTWAAIHEAAHVVLAIHFGHEVSQVSIRRELAGHTFSPSSISWASETELSVSSKASHGRLEEEIVVSLAGMVVERSCGRTAELVQAGGETDWHTIFGLLVALGCRNRGDAKARLAPLEETTFELVQQLFAQIKAVAEALMERGTLSGDEVRAVMGDARENQSGLQ